MPPCPLVNAFVPLKCFSRKLQFAHRVPFTKEKMPWCPCPFKNEAYTGLHNNEIFMRILTNSFPVSFYFFQSSGCRRFNHSNQPPGRPRIKRGDSRMIAQHLTENGRRTPFQIFNLHKFIVEPPKCRQSFLSLFTFVMHCHRVKMNLSF